MLLQYEDLEQLNLYTRDLSRLLFRSFFGCGVVCGLTVKATDNCGKTMVTVDAGVALGCIGDPIYVPKPVTFAATDGCDPDNPPSPLWVWLCSCPKCCAPRTPSCGCDDGDSAPACTREVDWYEIHLSLDKPECACGCDPLPITDPAQPPELNSAKLPGAVTHMSVAAPGATATKPDSHACKCADPRSPCYKDHYAGICGCKCEDSNCVVLAKLIYDGAKKVWNADHRFRRFIRPVLVSDPAVDPATQSSSVASPMVAMKKTAAKKTKT
jgi:hypothetical protein